MKKKSKSAKKETIRKKDPEKKGVEKKISKKKRPKKEGAAGKPKKTLLIVEDDKDTQTIYKHMLGKQYDLKIAGNTKVAMDYLNKDRIDLMILDIILPGEAGDSFFVKLKSNPKFSDLKTIIVTVIGDLTTEIGRIDPKISAIAKPFNKDELLEIIRKKIEER